MSSSASQSRAARATFCEEAVCGRARSGTLKLRTKEIASPLFMPVGTRASVKGVSSLQLEGLQARVVLGNTYHLMLRPGAATVAALGGLARFMGWAGGTLTDSGGYQVFSLARLSKKSDEGVVFQSHLDGARVSLTPELSMEVQRLLDADVAMLFDDCPPGGASRFEVEAAIRRTDLWGARSLAVVPANGQYRFGIVQGGRFADLRAAHLDTVGSWPVEGVALGGFSVGEPLDETYRLLVELAPKLPRDKPRYLMGMGTPTDLLVAIYAGMDMFDCVLPTRNARNGQALTFRGRLSLKQRRHERADLPIEASCPCETCIRYSRAYLRHLITSRERLGATLLSIHNLTFYQRLMSRAREAIQQGVYPTFARDTCEQMRLGDEVGERSAQPPSVDLPF